MALFKIFHWFAVLFYAGFIFYIFISLKWYGVSINVINILHCFFSTSEKAYDITYMTLRFQSPRPDSFAIYKKTAPDSDWTPYQFFSTSCQTTYGKQDVSGRWFIQQSEANEAFCKSEYSDIFPFSNGRIPFSTLEGRPGANDFDNSPVLQVIYVSLLFSYNFAFFKAYLKWLRYLIYCILFIILEKR